LLRDIPTPGASLLTNSSLSTRVSAQLSSLKGLHARLLEIRDYLDAVRQGRLPVNHQIIYQLQDIVNLLPDLGDDGATGKAFRVGVNDQMAVVYLSGIIRTVLALHDLSMLLDPYLFALLITHLSREPNL
jgi:26S proteasome regulatory subunit N8